MSPPQNDLLPEPPCILHTLNLLYSPCQPLAVS